MKKILIFLNETFCYKQKKKKKKKKMIKQKFQTPCSSKVLEMKKNWGAKKIVEQRFRTPTLRNGRGSKQKYKNLAKPAREKISHALGIAENAHVSILCLRHGTFI